VGLLTRELKGPGNSGSIGPAPPTSPRQWRSAEKTKDYALGLKRSSAIRGLGQRLAQTAESLEKANPSPSIAQAGHRDQADAATKTLSRLVRNYAPCINHMWEQSSGHCALSYSNRMKRPMHGFNRIRDAPGKSVGSPPPWMAQLGRPPMAVRCRSQPEICRLRNQLYEAKNIYRQNPILFLEAFAMRARVEK